MKHHPLQKDKDNLLFLNRLQELKFFQDPGRTLVLVNGLRRANYPYPSGEGDASFNWNRIPIGIVERIEILTSGASAVYGADAVAGVVNIILVDGIEDTSVQVRVGAHQPFTNRSAGESVNIEISGGQYFDNGSMVWGLELKTPYHATVIKILTTRNFNIY